MFYTDKVIKDNDLILFCPFLETNIAKNYIIITDHQYWFQSVMGLINTISQFNYFTNRDFKDRDKGTGFLQLIGFVGANDDFETCKNDVLLMIDNTSNVEKRFGKSDKKIKKKNPNSNMDCDNDTDNDNDDDNDDDDDDEETIFDHEDNASDIDDDNSLSDIC